MGDSIYLFSCLCVDPGSNSSGYYELSAVLTHQGRSSSSGHYLGWVKHHGNEWFKLDDDKVSVVLEEEILKLSGGGKGGWQGSFLELGWRQGEGKLEREEGQGMPSWGGGG